MFTRDRSRRHASTTGCKTAPVALADQALNLAIRISERYGISSVQALTEICRKLEISNEIMVAVLGRFKAGKSSFLNHLLGRELLPVGVVPVTAVVTAIGYGPLESAEVHHLDGRVQSVPLDSIRSFVAESDNPENIKQVEYLSIDLPELHRFEGLRFVDTPGLESSLAHNTQASREWLPKTGMALVAMSVDPPLSEQDIHLIETLHDYTPNVSLLVTKADILTEQERAEVLDFVRRQLTRRIGKAVDILPYSIRPGHDLLRAVVERKLADTLVSFKQQRTAILKRKTDTLLREWARITSGLRCEPWRRKIRSATNLTGSPLLNGKQLVTYQGRVSSYRAARVRRGEIQNRSHARGIQPAVEKRLSIALESEFPKWTASLAVALDAYQDEWLRKEMSEQLAAISASLRPDFIKPLEKTGKQVLRPCRRFATGSRRVQNGPLAYLFAPPNPLSPWRYPAPDIRISHIFDRNWELLSPVLPMWLIRKVVRGHFRRKLSFLVYANLSRLASQWQETILAALTAMEKDAGKRLDDLMKTVENLLSTDCSMQARSRGSAQNRSAARHDKGGNAAKPCKLNFRAAALLESRVFETRRGRIGWLHGEADDHVA